MLRALNHRAITRILGLLALFSIACDTRMPSAEHCEAHTIPVTLSGDAADMTYEVEGELCYNGVLDGKTTQFLSHGAGYGASYWDFPYQTETYSYVRAATTRGYATFNFSRLGVGESDIPPAMQLSIEADARILHQVIAHVQRVTAEQGHPIGRVVTVGHSMGSIITMAHGIQYPGEAEAIVLTGFVHHVNGDYVRSNIAGQVLAQDDPRFEDRNVGEGYISSSPEGRRAFYFEPTADEAVIQLDYDTREPVSLSEIFGIRAYYDEGAASLRVPVFEIVGDHDFIGCGTDLAGEVTLDCTDTDAVIANEAARFSAEACLETVVVSDAGHVLNLQENAPTTYAAMLEWLDRQIGPDHVQTGTAPCRNGE